MTDGQMVLVTILGFTDALFFPVLDWGAGKRGQNKHQGMRQFLQTGLPLISPDSSPVAKRSFSRLLDDVETAGLVRVIRPRGSGGQIPLVKLTTIGETQARSICGLPSIAASAALVVERLAGAPYVDPYKQGRRYVSERRLLHPKKDGPSRVQLLELAFPAAAKRWIEIRSTTVGEILYRIRQDSLEAAKAYRAEGPAAAVIDGAGELYRDYREDALVKLNSMTPKDPGDIGDMPLPASLGKEIEPATA